MGFDLVSKKPELGDAGYMRADIIRMIFFRSAMLAAGVPENLVYQKFLGNDGCLVTDQQSRTIAEKLRTWLKRRNLVVDFSEENERARRVNEAVLQVFQSLGDSKQKWAARKIRRTRSLPLRVDRNMRMLIKQFADFCGRSGGFWVD